MIGNLKDRIVSKIGAIYCFVFFLLIVMYFCFFNFELVGKPVVAYFDLQSIGHSANKNEVLLKDEGEFRVTVFFTHKTGVRPEKPLLFLTIRDSNQRVVLDRPLEPLCSSGAGGRHGSIHHSHFRYGLFNIRKDDTYSITLKTHESLDDFIIFQGRISKFGSNNSLYLLQVISFVVWLVAIILRKRLFRTHQIQGLVAYHVFIAIGTFLILLTLC